MHFRNAGWVLGVIALFGSCGTGRTPKSASRLTIAAAANLTDVFIEVGRAFTAKTGIQVIFSYGSTAQLSQQIENGAPFDLFAAADTEHIDALISEKKLVAESRAVYALGQLVLWAPERERSRIRELQDLRGDGAHFIAIAQPQLAPYGKAAVEALKNAGLWEPLQPKIVYANSINMAKQLAESGNAEAAFTAYSLVRNSTGTILKVDPRLYRPIEQALALVASAPQIEGAKLFRSFLLGAEGRAILEKNGYLLP